MTKKEIAVVLVLLAALIPCGAAFKLDFGAKARLNKSLQHARQIALGLRVYAGDEAGNYPAAEKDANEAFAQLIDEFNTEKIFYVPGSAWHGEGATKDGPDNLWEKSDPPGVGMDAGENACAYSTGLHDASPARIALIASGFSEKVGVYSKDSSKFGGVWGGTKCVVIFCDGSGRIGELNAAGRYIDPDRPGRDVFADPANTWLNPRAPKPGEAAAE